MGAFVAWAARPCFAVHREGRSVAESKKAVCSAAAPGCDSAAGGRRKTQPGAVVPHRRNVRQSRTYWSARFNMSLACLYMSGNFGAGPCRPRRSEAPLRACGPTGATRTGSGKLRSILGWADHQADQRKTRAGRPCHGIGQPSLGEFPSCPGGTGVSQFGGYRASGLGHTILRDASSGF
jgi:hypothetical protein